MSYYKVKNKFISPLTRTIGTFLLCASLLAGLIPLPFLSQAIPIAYGMAPVVNTTIAVHTTGTAPWDGTTWDGSDLTTAGLDTDASNNVVRLQDTVTYKVEVSLNDTYVEDLTSTVQLDTKQIWVKIPAGCKTDSADVTNQPVSSISADGRTLFCNLGSAIEGTKRVFYPTARALAATSDGDPVLNDDTIAATVSAQGHSTADGSSNVATDGPTEVTVTANFRVDTTKELKVTAVDPTTGEPLYKAPAKEALDGTDGSVMEYVIKVQYQKGSMIADAPNEAGGDYEIDFVLLDHYTDDNNNNNGGGLSTGAVLYDWDPAKPACELVGNHGPNATVNCAQVDHLLDQLGPSFTPDGVNDPNIEIDLQNIDVRDPDGDTNLVELRINIWYSEPDDIATTQNCPPTPCEIMTINSVGVYDSATSTVNGFNPKSTEDFSGNNLLNYNGAGEAHPEYVTYPLFYSTPGPWNARKSFYGGSTNEKASFTRSYAPGQTIPFLLNTYDYRYQDGAQSQVCDKIDTNNFEYVGLSDPYRTDLEYSLNTRRPYNPFMGIQRPTSGYYEVDAAPFSQILYSAEPHATLLEQRDDNCADDINEDGTYVVDGVDMATGAATGLPNDWVTNPTLLPNGNADVSKIRWEITLDLPTMVSTDPASDRVIYALNLLMKIKGTATGYANPDGNTYLPNYSTSRIHSGDSNWGSWRTHDAAGDNPVSIDPNDASFSFENFYADRVILVPSSIGLEKYTEPRGIKIVKGGDIVDFIIEPTVSGGWAPSITTADVDDTLPNGTSYVVGSERFSIDGGTTWLTYDAYAASNPAVTITSPPNTHHKNLDWYFGDLQTGEQTPLIRYSVLVDPTRVSGNFTNRVDFTSDIGVDEDNDGTSDVKEAEYQISILPQEGLQVLKSVDDPVYEVNEPFVFDLIYTNLGDRDYTQADFIDILPFSNDGSGLNTSGLASTRMPSSGFNGIYDVTEIVVNNSETVYATNAASTSIQQDPCHESNQPAGYTPVSGDLCYMMYVDNGNAFAGGSATGTATTTWTQCTSLSPVTCGTLTAESITGLRFDVPSVLAADGGHIIQMELSPTGNVGGTPDLDAENKVTANSTGDIYTNNFGGRVPEISLLIISNDVSVTVVDGTIGDTVWWDDDGDGNGPVGAGNGSDTSEPPIPGATVSLLDGTGAPIYVDPATGGIVPSTWPGAIPYTTVTDANGQYLFENLPSGNYQVSVTPPTGGVQTYDSDGVGTSNISDVTLAPVTDSADIVIEVEDDLDQDFGYQKTYDLALQKSVRMPLPNPLLGDGKVSFDLTIFNQGVTVQEVDVTDYIDNTMWDAFSVADNPNGTAISGTVSMAYTWSGGGSYAPVVNLTGLLTDTHSIVVPITLTIKTPVAGSLADLENKAEISRFDTDNDPANGDSDQAGTGAQLVDEDSTPDGTDDDIVKDDVIDEDGKTNAADDEDDHDIALLPIYDLALTKERSAGQGYAADFSTTPPTASFDITVKNQGPNPVTDVMVEDYVPTGMSIQSSSIPTTSLSGFNVGSIAPGASVTFTVVMAINDLSQSPYVNAAEISSMSDSNGDPVSDIDSLADSTDGNDLLEQSSTDPDNADNSHNDIDNDRDANGDPIDTSTTDEDDHDTEVIVAGLSLGSTLFYDNDNDGIQDVSESGIPTITVELLDSNGAVIATTTTDINGDYVFDNLPPGDYQVQIPTPPTDAPASSTPTGTTDDDVDSDDNGDQPGGPGTVTTSPVITLEPGTEPTNEPGQGGGLGSATDALGNMTVDFGFTPYVSLGSTLFYDNDNSGQQGAGETGIDNIVVELLDVNGAVVMTTTTDINGDYLFDELVPGDYQVRVPTAPTDAPTSSTPTGTADDNVDGDDNGTQTTVGGPSTSPMITLTADGEPMGETEQGGAQDAADDDNGDMTVDFGFVPPLSIGSTLFYDNDNDGIQDVGESGIPTITVELLDSTGAVIATTTTDSNGDYVFDNLLPGDYQVQIPTPPTDAPTSSTPTNTADDGTDGDDNGDQPGGAGSATISPMITLAVGSEATSEPEQGGSLGTAADADGDMTVDFGFAPYVSLGSTLFYDNDNSGQQDAGETGIDNIVVELLDVNGAVVMTTTTDINGDYLFDELMPGDYQVRVPTAPTDAPTSSTPTSTTDDNVDGDDNGTQSTVGGASTSPMITLTADGEPTSESAQGGTQDAADDDNGDMTVDFGFVPPLSLGSTLFYDNDNDGIQDMGESGIPTITVELLDSTGAVITTTTTDSNGDYVFDNLLPGDYQVRVPTPPGDAPLSSTPTSTSDDDVDGNDDGDQPGGIGTAATSPVITLAVGSEPASEPEQGGGLGSAADIDGNMTIDFGFTDYVSLGSTLFYDNDNDGLQGTGETGIANIVVELLDASGSVAMTTTTDVNGDYLFDELMPGDYQVRVPTAPGDAPNSSTPTNMTDDNVDGDDNGDQPGGTGAATTSPVISLVVDDEPTAAETAQAGTQDDALDDDNGDMTVDFGFVPPLSLGSTLFYDNDNNGQQDAGETGIAGVSVELLDSAGNVVATTTTDANGDYVFDDLLPGDYQVQIPTPPSDAPMSSTTTNTNDDDVDGDDNGDQPGGFGAPTTSPMITLAVGSEPTSEPGQGGSLGTSDDADGNMSIDFGFVPPLSLGSTLFYDNDNDGTQTAGEAGISGITVELHDTAGNVIATTTTDVNGDYLFDELLPGDYQVVVPTAPSDAPTSSTPTNMADDNVDGDDNGDQPGGAGAATTSPVITLAVDSEPAGETEQGGTQDAADDDNGDMTVDFGFAPYVSLGSTIFHDNDNNGLQDSNDAGIAGVIVELYDDAGNLAATTTTDSNGDYLFDELLPGDYQVVIPTAPSDAPVSSQPTSMADDNVDGDDNGDQPGGSGAVTTSPVITLHADTEPVSEAGQGGMQDVADDDNGDMTVDFGFFEPVSVGDTVWYDDNDNGQQDAGEAGVAGVTVNLFDSAGNPVTDVNGNPVGPATTDANGNYLFEDLPPGDYYVEFDLSTLPGPEWYVGKQDESGVADDEDSDADPNSGQTSTTPFLSSGEEDITLDMGIVAPVTVGDRVWYDDNRDGIQDVGEAGVQNVLAVLHDTATGQPVVDQLGVPMIDTTDANGDYLFENLPPGDYYVEFQLNTLPGGYVVTQPDQGSDDALDSDADPSTGVTAPTGFLPSNTEDLTLDMGIYRPEGVRVGDKVWMDNDRDGEQDAGEPGVPGVTATLVDSAGNPVTQDRDGNPITPQVTDASGNYLFDNLPPGDYAVVFDLNTLPANHLVTSQDSGSDDLLDSDVDPATGMTPSTGPLADDEQDLSLDLGIYPAGNVTVGDTVWYDDNHDGIQDMGEAGVANVTVNLFDSAGNAVTDMNGNPVGPATTDSNGNYLFEELPAGDYYVEFDLSSLPAGYQPTFQDSGSDDAVDSDADPTSGQTAPTGFLNDGEEDLTLDMGIVAPVSVGDTVWYDDDSDGMQDSGESGVAGVTVELFDASGNPVTDMAGNPVAPVVTDSNGNYTFDNLPPGDYAVQFDLSTLPSGYVPTAPDMGGNDGADSDASPSTGETPSTGFLPSGSNDSTLDMGIVQLAGVRVGDRVWYDDDRNGVQDTGEAGVAGVTVELFDASGNPVTDMAGNPVGPTTTDANGNYLFEDLPAGDYYVQFDLGTLPMDSIVTLQDAGGDDAADSDADPATGESATTGDLAPGEEDLTLDMGIYRPASIGDTVWLDEDADGIQDAGEAGIENVVVELFNADGTPATDMNGNPMTTTTDANGNYEFDDLYPGDYYVEFTAPAGYNPSPQDAGGDDSEDSDADPITGQTAVTTLSSGENDPTWDAGFYQPVPGMVRVGDRVWYDDDRNGLQDAGEDGVAGVTVELFDAAGNSVTDINGNPVGPTTTDADGNYIFDNLPDGDYYVQFDLGTLPVDSILTLQDAGGNDVIDSDADLNTGESATTGDLVAGEEDLTLDMGIYRPASIGDTVWEDLDADGVQDAGEAGIEGVIVELFNADGTPATDMNGNPMTTTTDANGNYAFDDLYPGDYYVEFTAPAGYDPSPQDAGGDDSEDSDADPVTGQTTVTTLSSGENDPTWDAGFYQPDLGMVRVGDRVWYDDDRNGVQDAGEDGVAGVTVELFDAAGNSVTDINGDPVGPTTTDADGNYIFDNLPEGDYYVQFDLGTLPTDSIVTVQDAGGDDADDSDADPATGETATTGDLAAGEEDLTLDMGIYRLASIGDTVWLDEDADGVQDAGEAGIENVVVELFNADGTPATDMNGNPMTTLTDANGNYAFDDLYPGDYYVEFTTPAGYSPSPQDAGGDDGEDSDADPITGQTAVTTLSSGENDPTWDAGFYLDDPVVTPTPIVIPMPDEVRVGDRVWYDNDGDGVQDAPADEPGVEGVIVTLYNADGTLATDLDGNVVAPAITDADGNYLFENLPEGDYYVDFDLNTLPAGYQVTEQDAGGDDGADSDGDPTTGHSGTTGFLPEGSEDLTLDLGIVAPVTVGDRVWYDYDGDGTQDDPADEPGVEDVTVILLNADGTPATDMAGNPVAPAMTDADGNYLFENLPPGGYQVMFDLDTLPGNHMVTEQNAGSDDGADSDADPATGLTDPTGPLMAGDEDLSLDLGILPTPPVEVGDTVWYDEDSDGIQDAGEEGVEGVTVMLFNADGSPVTDMDGNPVGPVTTDSNGDYLFDNLPEGDYYVQFDLTTLPDGYEVTEQDAGSDDGADSDGDPVSGVTAPTGFLSAGSSDMSLDLGVSPVQPVRIGNYVWYDDDRNGIQDGDEAGVENVTVTLFNADGSPVTDMDGNSVGTQTTDSNGEYLFENLPPGDYFVQFDLDTLPELYAVTEANTASDQTDSDANTSTGETDSTGFLAGGSEDLTLDMGIIMIDPDVRVGDRVWLDEDKDGLQDAGEPGVEDVVVDLYDTVTNELLDTTMTDADGNYLFDELFPGDYYVQFDLNTLPGNHAVTELDATNDQSPETSDQLDSDVSSEDGVSAPTGILFNGEEDLSLDMGIYPIDEVSVGDIVWYDSDSDGIQDPGELGVEDVTVTLYDTATGDPVPSVSPQQTDSNGNYLFADLPAGDYSVVFDLDTLPDGYDVTTPNATNDQQPATSDQMDSDVNPANGQTGPTGPLAGSESDLTLDMGIVQQPGVTVGDLVWYDDNADGIQDPAEVGVAGVSVSLYDETTGQPVMDAAGEPLMQVTDGNGEYLFTDLPPGQYSVQFELDTLPDGYVVSPAGQEPSDTADSDAGEDGRTGSTDVLVSGDEDRTLDMGIFKPVQVGDTVWFDDGNGQQDPGEEGVADVTVVLYDAETGELVGTTMTDENGNYLFDDLSPGNYLVEFDLTSLPEGYMVTTPDMEGDDDADSDADPETGRTPETGFLGSGEADLSLDMGIVMPVSIGDLVWFDEDMDGLQGPEEKGVADVTVTLYDAAGAPVATTTTDENGSYLFEGLPPGDYSVGFDLATLPEGYVVTQANAASDQTDSDASPDDGRTSSTGFLPSGSAVRDLDMGIHMPAKDEVRVGGHIWEDTNLNDTTDPGEKLWPSITVVLYSQDDPTRPIATAVTDENGNYLFENLPEGQYFTTLDPDSLPAGALPPSYYSAGTPDDLRSNSDELTEGDESLELDMALRFPASLSGLAWLDTNGDGVRSVDEEVLGSITVELYDATGEKVGELQTNPDGTYLFDDLIPGDYRVVCPATKGYNLSPNLQGEDSSRDSDIDPATSESGTKFVGSGQHLPDIDLGLYEQGSITNLIWVDVNSNGVLDGDEAGIAGVTVYLYNAANEVVGETVTDAEGRYGFSGLVADDYYIAFKPPADLLLVTDAVLTADGLVRGPTISVSGGSNISALDIGFTQPAALGNYVWLDTDKDGLLDSDEIGVVDTVVRLLDAEGNLVESTMTDSDGRFEFLVAPGDYQLEFVAKEGMEFTLQNQGDDSIDSDVDPETGRTVLISLGSNMSDFSHYAGLIISPTAIQLMSLVATETTSGVTIEWNTGAELSTFGFEVYRSRDGVFENAIAVTEGLVLARGDDTRYTFTDVAVDVGQIYSYWLVEVQSDQQAYHYGPARVMVEGLRHTSNGFMIFLPLIER